MFVVEVMLELLRWHQLKTLAANPSIFAVRVLSCEMVVQEESLKLTHFYFLAIFLSILEFIYTFTSSFPS
jgi:hypothetical protein